MPPARKKTATGKPRASSAPEPRITRQTSSSANEPPPPAKRKYTRKQKEPIVIPDDPEAAIQENKDTENLNDVVAQLQCNAQESQDAVDEIRSRLDQCSHDILGLTDSVRNLVDALKTSVPGISNAPSTAPAADAPPSGTNPLSFIEEHLPWVDSSTVTSIVAGKLDPKDLSLLIPLEERPNKRGAQRSNLHYDHATGTFATVNDPPTAYEKDFPSVEYLVYALSVYGTIRGLYDGADKTGIAAAILLHIKRIVRDVAVGNYEWKSIVGYVIAHFRKHQKSTTAEAWINTDSELFFSHIKAVHNPVSAPARPTTKNAQPPSLLSRLPRPDPSSEICKNWNNAGCSWAACTRKHICAECRLPGHKQSQCTGKGKPQPKPDAAKGDKQ
jgi:hypothetical protein